MGFDTEETVANLMWIGVEVIDVINDVWEGRIEGGKEGKGKVGTRRERKNEKNH